MEQYIKELNNLSFKNKGIVTRNMMFEYRSRPCHYMEDVDQWATRYGGAYYNYLYQIENNIESAPPVGMRSAVPLGGLGAGTVELRADGSFKDWNIFNNTPASAPKVQIDEAIFYVWIKEKNKDPKMKTLRTHAPNFLPSIEQIEYSGAYPVSKLTFTDSELPVIITLYAFSELKLYDEKASATPAVIFSYSIENLSSEEIELALMFVLPNQIGGKYYLDRNHLVLAKDGESLDSGEMMISVDGNGLAISGVQADSIFGIQREYGAYGEFSINIQKEQEENPIDGCVGRMYFKPEMKKYGCISAKIKVKPNTTNHIEFILAWYFPYRTHAGKLMVNYYTTLYKSAQNVVDSVRSRLLETVKSILQFHALCFNNSLPAWLQEGMVNSLATIAKTGIWFRDYGWCQWESFSCPAIDPIHIHFYRSLPYAWFFKEMRRNQLRKFAECQREDGYIEENLARSTDVVGKPIGRMMGDGCTAFILEVYQDYLWTNDTKCRTAL